MPRLALYYVENHKIEIVHTYFGKEIVLLNEKKISESDIKSRTPHIFMVDKHKYRITRRDYDKVGKMNSYEIHKDGVPLALKNADETRSPYILVLIIIVGVGLGYIFGAFVYQLFLSPSTF